MSVLDSGFILLPTLAPVPASARVASQFGEVVLVTGISGSGKSVALHALEDAGFFCVDNLPPELLREFLRLERQRSERRRGDRRRRAQRRLAAAPAAAAGAAAQRRRADPLGVHRRQHRLAGAALLRDAPAASADLRAPGATTAARSPATTACWSMPSSSSASCSPSLREMSTVVDTSELRPAQLRAWMRDLVAAQRQRADAGVRVVRLPRAACRSTPTTSSTCACCPIRTTSASCGR